MGEFVGDTRRGGSCNVDQLSLIPHCNGTHTESVGHIVDQTVPLGGLLTQAWLVADLISVQPVSARETKESYRPELDHHDYVVTAHALKKVAPETASTALIIRTLPNPETKTTLAYGQPQHPAFLTVEAMQWILGRDVQHLLLDLPSVDKMYDEGLLTNHHIFWNVPESTHGLTKTTFKDKTITEMIFVRDQVPDGRYVLSLQIPAFVSDAAPSRPMLYPIQEG